MLLPNILKGFQMDLDQIVELAAESIRWRDEALEQSLDVMRWQTRVIVKQDTIIDRQEIIINELTNQLAERKLDGCSTV